MGKYPLLDEIESPADIRRLPESDLPRLCGEVRDYLIDTLSMVGGHFASNLGVVELTVALHYVLETPADKLIWDVGHQIYPHKILTGRRERLKSVRRRGGLSGFPRRDESPYDLYNTGHAGTSISQLLGEAMNWSSVLRGTITHPIFSAKSRRIRGSIDPGSYNCQPG